MSEPIERSDLTIEYWREQAIAAESRLDTATKDLEQGFMQGAYARLKSLQETERLLEQYRLGELVAPKTIDKIEDLQSRLGRLLELVRLADATMSTGEGIGLEYYIGMMGGTNTEAAELRAIISAPVVEIPSFKEYPREPYVPQGTPDEQAEGLKQVIDRINPPCDKCGKRVIECECTDRM